MALRAIHWSVWGQHVTNKCMEKAGEVPLVNFEKLQYGQHNIVDKAEARRFSLFCMMQPTYMKNVLGVCARLEGAGISQAVSMLKASLMRYQSVLARVSAGLSNKSSYRCFVGAGRSYLTSSGRCQLVCHS